MKAVKCIFRYLKCTLTMGLWYPKGSYFALVGYSDSDFAGCKVDRKSTLGGCQFLGRALVSWSSNKQNLVALSTAEAEYMVAGACCAQLLYMRQTLRDYGHSYIEIPLYCDSTSAINMALNEGNHGHAKHIEIKHHFIRDHVAKKDIELISVQPHDQLADILTKPLDEKNFTRIRRELIVLDLSNFK